VGSDVTSVLAKAGVKGFCKINFKTRMLLKTCPMKNFLTFDYSQLQTYKIQKPLSDPNNLGSSKFKNAAQEPSNH
jgi:hypothetical protein